MRTWFVTGGTGFLGGQILRELSARGDRVFALVRPTSLASLPAALTLKGVEWIRGDIQNPDVVADHDEKLRVLAETTHVCHLAALYDLKASRRDLYLANVVGTHNLLHLAESIPKLQAFHYASTIAVAGDYSGIFTEEMFDVGQGFPDAYASTKFAAEAAVRGWEPKIPRVVHRLGILVGHSETGEMPKIDGPYYLLRALHRISPLKRVLQASRFLVLPFNERTRLYMVPVNVTAQAMAELSAQSFEPGLHTFHLTGDPRGAPVRTVLREMLSACGYDVHVLAVTPAGWMAKVAARVDIPAETLFYMTWGCRFDNYKFVRRLPKFDMPFFESYAPRVLGHALNEFAGKGH